MIGPEDIHDTPKPNYTPILILGIAAVLLLIVGFISYRDYVNAKSEKALAESNSRIQKLESQIAQLAEQGGLKKSTSAAVPDPELEQLRRQLSEMKAMAEKNAKMAEENSLKMDKVLETKGDDISSADNFLPPIPDAILNPPGVEIEDEVDIPDYVRDSVAAPPGMQNNSEEPLPLTNLQKQIKNAPAIGKVLSYTEKWNVVAIDAGSQNNVKSGDRYSIRRGNDILGIIKIRQVEAGQSIGSLVGGERYEEAPAPQSGDEIILFEPF